MVLNTGTPQGCPLSPKLYSIFTFDCKTEVNNNIIVKFADDTTIIGLIHDDNESEYREQVDLLVDWCSTNNLILNVSKTKEIVVDYRHNKLVKDPLIIQGIIQGKEVEHVESFKLLGTHLTRDLTWSINTKFIAKKARQRLYFLRKLKSYGVNRTILINFYKAIIESILTASILVWYGKITQMDLAKLNSIVHSAEKLIGCELSTLGSIFRERAACRTRAIMNDCYHPAKKYFRWLPSERRLKSFSGTKRFLNSTYPCSVRLFNKSSPIFL